MKGFKRLQGALRDVAVLCVAAAVLVLITDLVPDPPNRPDVPVEEEVVAPVEEAIRLPRGWTLEELQARHQNGQARWRELCGRMDCSELPLGYHTFQVGDIRYYFPTSATARAQNPQGIGGQFSDQGGYLDLAAAYNPRVYEPPVRSYAEVNSIRMTRCCDTMLRFYGLADAMPPIRSPDAPHRFLGAVLHLQPLGREARYGTEPAQTLEDFLATRSMTLSYNEDFWIGGVGEPNASGFRQFGLVSKEPLFHGRHVVVGCTLPLCPHCSQECSFRMIDFLGDAPDPRPHMRLQWVGMTTEPLFTCALEEVAAGCDPSPEAFDGVPEMLAILEAALEAATVYPHPDSRAP